MGFIDSPALPTDLPLPLDQELLAWAAGFFDGEGSTFARTDAARPGYRQLQVTVPQAGTAVPEVLRRFQSAMLSLGRIDTPGAARVFMWRARGRTDAEIVLALLWPYLGEVKRRQASAALRAVEHQYASGLYRRRVAKYSPVLVPHPAVRTGSLDRAQIERAWAAGFLDAEGCFGLARAGARKRGPDWYRIRASASQHGPLDEPADVLLRLRSVLGLGRIERHGDPDDFRWCAEGASAVSEVLNITRPWLGTTKIKQAEGALHSFGAQVRLRSGGELCLRGHSYDRGVVQPNGDVRKYCNACARMLQRGKRAAEGIPPRQFRNVARRYPN